MEKAETKLIRHCQKSSFPEETQRLQKQEQVSSSSKLASLNPFLDELRHIIRARGWLENDQRTPIVLPVNYRRTHLLIGNIHRRNGHIGLKHVVSKLRENFWLLCCIFEVKKILSLFRARFERTRENPRWFDKNALTSLLHLLQAPVTEQVITSKRISDWTVTTLLDACEK